MWLTGNPTISEVPFINFESNLMPQQLALYFSYSWRICIMSIFNRLQSLFIRILFFCYIYLWLVHWPSAYFPLVFSARFFRLRHHSPSLLLVKVLFRRLENVGKIVVHLRDGNCAEGFVPGPPETATKSSTAVRLKDVWSVSIQSRWLDAIVQQDCFVIKHCSRESICIWRGNE